MVSMSSPLLSSKLFIPRSGHELVVRARLIERLREGLRCPLTLVSAPAGFGKTTLVSEWIHQTKWPATWLSLDQGDDDVTRFLSYLISALQRVKPDFAHEALTALQSAQSPPTDSIDSILTAILKEVAESFEEFVLVLDDYHVIEDKTVHSAFEFLIEHADHRSHSDGWSACPLHY